ncbi:MAG: heavy-metal-associated domain-containing protein [Anaerolineales bacterium]
MSEHENCHVEPLEKPLDQDALSKSTVAYLAVSGMGCPRCATRVRNGLLSLGGVLQADIFLEQGLAAAAYDPQQVTVSDLIGAVAGAGNDGRHSYQAQVLRTAPAAEALKYLVLRGGKR